MRTHTYIDSTNSSECNWRGTLEKFLPDGQCQDDGDECIYIIGMDSNDTYIQTWQQGGCYDTYPFYVNDNNEYLCKVRNDWTVLDINCTEWNRIKYDWGAEKHELAQCVQSGDIFECSGFSEVGFGNFVTFGNYVHGTKGTLWRC